MSYELWVLLAAVLLGLVHLSAAAFTFKAQVGNAYTVGARDADLKPVGTAARLHRANANFLETFPYFAASILVVQLVAANGALSWWGATAYLAGRLMFLPLYAFGLPWVRSLSWNLATLGLVLVGSQAIAASLR